MRIFARLQREWSLLVSMQHLMKGTDLYLGVHKLDMEKNAVIR